VQAGRESEVLDDDEDITKLATSASKVVCANLLVDPEISIASGIVEGCCVDKEVIAHPKNNSYLRLGG
jgi:hypothetical protein